MIFTLIATSLGAAGFTGAMTIFGLSPGLSAAIIGFGKSVLWSAASRALAPKVKVPSQQVQATIAQAAGSRIRGYGRYLLGGTRAMWEAKDGVLHQIVVMHHGEINAVTGWMVDGEVVTLDGSGITTSGSAEGYVQIQRILSGDGGNYSAARAAFPTIWTTAHKLTGQATFYSRMTAPALSELSKVFPRQSNTSIQAICQLSKVLDPRTMVVGYSDLTGPAVLDYLTHEDGYRVPMAQVDLASFAQFTSLCDSGVALKGGGSEKRYRVGGYYTLDDAPKDVMSRLLMTADAQLYMTAEGKIGILGGEWLEPDVTITGADILSLSLSDGFDEFSDFNVLKGKFTSPDHRYQETECAELVDTVALASQPQRVETLEIDMCPSHSQMQRLMRAYRAGQLREFTGTLRTNLVGLKARFPRGRGKHVIRLVWEEFGIDQTFEVLSHSYSVAERECVMQIASIDNPYAWDPASMEGDAPPPLDGLDKPVATVPVPSGLTLSQEVIENASGQNSVRIKATVDDPGRASLQLRLQYREQGTTVWQAMTVDTGDLRGYSPTVSGGRVYEVRASWSGYSTWSSLQSITAVANPVAPDAPTGFGSSLASGTVTLTWTNGDTGFYRTRVYRSATANLGDAVLIATVAGIAGSTSVRTDTPGTGTWRYWVVTINASLVESSATGPQTHTV